MAEVWAPIEGFPGYDVSTKGRVRSWKGRGGAAGSWTSKPRITKPSKSNRGYLRVHLTGPNGKVTSSLHRLVALAFVPGYEPGLVVCHNNSVKTDNRAENLRWDTISANAIDASKLGDVPRQVLQEAQVIELRSKYASGGHSHRTLAAEYGITHQAVRDIIIKKNYRWVA